MSEIKYINGFKIKNDENVYKMKDALSATTAEHANSAENATYAETAGSVDSIGNVQKYSGIYGGKQREGLKIVNGSKQAVIELNDKGNLAVESLSKSVNLEAQKNIQVKATEDVIFDSGRRLAVGEGNEVHLKFKYDDYDPSATGIYDGDDEEWAELKIQSRNMDLRCHDHGGIALQIAGKDSSHHENKIKFESDRTNNIGASGTYNGEGGKGLEFGTFNNEHASLFCGDYRFKGDADVYGVTRGQLSTNSKGKTDYPTQGDDFKDILDPTNKATWNEIIDAAKKCRNLEETITDAVNGAVVSGVDMSIYVTNTDVEDVVAEAIANAHIDTTGLATEAWVLDKGYIEQVAPDITLNQYALQHAKIGKKKGNFAIDVTGKYTWEEKGPDSATTLDEHDNIIEAGDRVGDFDGDGFFEDENKVYYVAQTATTLADNTTSVASGTIVYNSGCLFTFNVADGGYAYYPLGEGETSYYEDPEKYLFKGKKNKAKMYNEETPITAATTLNPSELSQEEITYYESQCPVYDVDGETIIVEGKGWEKVMIWKKKQLWAKNEININLETDSKIKFAGKKIETVWTYEENGEDVDHKMDEILLSTNSLATDANEVVFEQKISKNGDHSGQDSDIVYSFTNNVYPLSYKDFKKNYNDKHTPKGDDELQPMHEAFVAEGPSFEIRVKVSELLGLVNRVTELEGIVSDLTTRIEALEGTQVPEPEPAPEPEPTPEIIGTVYSFTSYGDSGCTLEYGTGTAQVIALTESSTTISVLTNSPEESFVGHQYVVNSTELVEGGVMQLFETDGTPVEIWVRCSLAAD